MRSIVIPVYGNEAGLPALLDALSGVAAQVDGVLEIVFVVDGSPDHSAAVLRKALPMMPFQSQLVMHSRNYGAFAAIRTGLQAARGDCFAVMAADLQEPPSLVQQFFEVLAAGDADVVVGQREARDDPWPQRWLASSYWWLYRTLVMPEIPVGGVDVFGCNKKFRDELIKLEEVHSSLIGQIFWLGFERKHVLYQRQSREHGKSAWTFSKKLRYLMDSVFSFSDLPIRVLMVLGVLGLVVSVVLGLVIVWAKLVAGISVAGYATTVMTILFFGGLNTLGLGIIGAYVWRAFGNTQGRPIAVVRGATIFDGKSQQESS